MGPFKDIGVNLADMVATIEIRRPPHNFFDIDLIRQIADACEALDKDPACRAIVLAAQGTAFCAGAKLGEGADVQDVLVKRSETGQAGHLYIEAVRLYRTAKPMVGAIHGAAVGGGLGLALVPDLRESQSLDTLDNDAIDLAIGFKAIHLKAGAGEAEFTGTERARREWTTWILLALLFFAVGEMVWAWVCGRAW